MYHFFVKDGQIAGSEITIAGSDVNHIRNVLRMKPGEQVRIGNGLDRDFLCVLEEIAAETVTARIVSEAEDTELSARLCLFQGLPKSDKMELIIQKAVELGAYQIVPVATHRAVVKLDGKREEGRLRRWNAIAESAAKQSKRVLVPEVCPVLSFREALKQAKKFDVKLLLYENARGMRSMAEAAERIRPGTTVGIFVGPEGGFEETEVREAELCGWSAVSLGRRILRTETAGLAALAILMYCLETAEWPEIS